MKEKIYVNLGINDLEFKILRKIQHNRLVNHIVLFDALLHAEAILAQFFSRLLLLMFPTLESYFLINLSHSRNDDQIFQLFELG